jgi:uncharacterized membrane protein
MQSLLTDRVQRHSMAFIIGALAYVLVVFRAVPDGGAGLSAVPHLAVGVASLLALLVAGILVFIVHDAARAGRAGGVVRRLSDACIARIRRGHPPAGAGRDRRAEPPRASAPGESVRAADRGWVLTVDERRILAALPPGGTAEVAVRPGQFLVEGVLLGTVWADGRADAGVGVRAAIRLGSDPVLDEDVGYGIRQLVDIAERSLESSASDSTTAREVILHLGGVLRELLLRDLPPCVVAGDDGRRLLRANEAGFADYVDLAFDRIRISGAHLPEIGVTLLSTIGMLVRELERAGLGERARPLQCQAALIVDAAEAATALSHDADRVRRLAEAKRLCPPRSQPRAGADLRG